MTERTGHTERIVCPDCGHEQDEWNEAAGGKR